MISESSNNTNTIDDLLVDMAADLENSTYDSVSFRSKYEITPTLFEQVDNSTIKSSLFTMCDLQYVVIAWDRRSTQLEDTSGNGTLPKATPLLYKNGDLFYGGEVCKRCNQTSFQQSAWKDEPQETTNEICMSHSYPLLSPFLLTAGPDPLDKLYVVKEHPDSIDYAYLYHSSYQGEKPPYEASYDQLGNLIEIINRAVGPLFIFFVSTALYMMLKIGALILKADDKDYKTKSFLASQGANLILFHPVVQFANSPLIFFVVYEGIVDYARIILLVYIVFAALLIIVVIISGNKKGEDGKSASYNLLAVSVLFLTILVITGLVVSIIKLVQDWVNTAEAVLAFFSRLTSVPFLFPRIDLLTAQFPLIATAFLFQTIFAFSLLGMEYLQLSTDFIESMCCGSDIGGNGAVADDVNAKNQGIVVARDKLMAKEEEYAEKDEEEKEKKKKQQQDDQNNFNREPAQSFNT